MTTTAPALPLPLALPGAAPCLRLLRHEPDPDDETPRTPAAVRRLPPPAPVDLRPTADLRRHAHRVVRLALEVVDGRRPMTHLAPHIEPCVLRYVRAARGTRPSARTPRRLTSLHVSRPCAGAVEVAAVHTASGRTRVLAARFEGHPDQPDRWRCCSLRLL